MRNNSNLPDGNTYDDNAYTRYLRKILNIQNKSVYMEREDRYDEFVNILVKDQTRAGCTGGFGQRNTQRTG